MAYALNLSGKYREAIAVAAPAAAEAKGLGYRPLAAEALVRLGLFQRADSDTKAAERTLTEAILAAVAGRHDAVAAEALIEMVAVCVREAHYEQAHEWGRFAFAAIERLG